MIPVPGFQVGTPYGRRGPYWSCDRDVHGDGIHTGVDYPAPVGTPVAAARPGRVSYCDHGSAFGGHQLEITPGDGTRDFYAHMTSRTVADGSTVQAGQRVGTVGAEGNASGPHLHFERHTVATGGWSCAVVTNPQPSIDYQEEDDMTSEDWDKLRRIVADEVKQNNKPASETFWGRMQDVTTPNGDKVSKSMKQIARETWQRVAKL